MDQLIDWQTHGSRVCDVKEKFASGKCVEIRVILFSETIKWLLLRYLV